ncbi:mechanosensitive ion channel domain-containing protein [Desulfovibrio sp. TomC]|uniref:mechanosensitive ion channel domain-containing protein n=1 Tax=Desulfovibrio sp. TomC TaxID=1562888 RepID=UPI0005756A30|nr:mechanosensitive ion channel domain-containing protein [Desulfovibrio sp. TomC]KHK03871.1 Potassium efflux system KefA protein / Small-conductance mechanosensitive channel [Desulfovibrio sp. TomC]
MTPRRAPLAGLLLALLWLLAAAVPPIADDDASWTLVLDALHKQDTIIRSRLGAFKARHAVENVEQNIELEHLLRDRARLALWQATASDPWEIRTVLAGLERIRLNVEHLSQRPQQAWASLEQNVALLESYRDKLGEISRQQVPERFRDTLEPTRRSVQELGAEVAALRDQVAEQAAPLRELSEQLKTATDELQTALAPAWKTYYKDVNPTIFTSSFLRYTSEDIEDWLLWSGLGLELLRTPAMGELLLDGIGMGCLAAALLGGLALLTRRFAAGRGASKAALAVGFKASGCAAAGAFFVTLAQFAPFFLFTQLISIGEILFSAALVHLSRLGRNLERDAKRPAVLWPTWRIFALGLLLESGRYPDTLDGPVMAIMLGLAGWGFWKRYKAVPVSQRLDRSITRILAFALPPLAATSLLGLPQTAILCASGLFYVALALRFAAMTTRTLGQMEVDRHQGRPPIFLGILTGAGFPFFFLTFLFLFLWLLSNQFGGENVFLEILNTETRVESVGISLNKLVLLLFGYYAARALIALSATFITELSRHRQAVERGAKATLLTINTYLWWGLYTMFAMAVLGLSLTSVAVVAGGLSVGIGFGLQTTVNNFVSGLILLFGRSVQAGDTIQLGDGQGVVKEVNIRNTEVLTNENATVFVPNSELVSGKITNWSHTDPSVRRDISVGVAYGSDTAKVRQLLLAAAAECPAVMTTPPPAVLHWDFGASTLDFRLRIWLVDVAGAVTAMSLVREAIDRLFRGAGIEIAYPQADLHLRTAPALEALAKPQQEETVRLLTSISARLDALEKTNRRPAPAGDDAPKGSIP